MAQIQCRWRNVLICVCCPCICMVLLIIYVGVVVCMEMNSRGTPGGEYVTPGTIYFEASGYYRRKSLSSLPKTWWKLHTDGDPLWNRLQLPVDRYFSPILSPNNSKKGFKNDTFLESPLTQSFSDVVNSNGTSRNFTELPEQIKEFVRHMHRRDYRTVHQPSGVCGAGAQDQKENTLLLLAIKTTELNFKNRQAIRQAWGQVGWVAGQNSSGGYVRRVFLIGKEDPIELGVNISELLELENKHYGDILQWNFKDTFFNLTLKDVLFWSWFSRYCHRTQFLFKGDDDVFVNTANIVTYLQDQLKRPNARKTLKDFMVGDVIAAALPDRSIKSKYFIPESFYKGNYPAYAGGGGVVYSGLLAKRLHRMSKRVHLFPIDDVYVGMCMIRLNAYPIHHPAFLTFDFPGKEEEELCAYHKILLVHKRSPAQIVRLTADIKKTQAQCRDVPLRDGVKKGK